MFEADRRRKNELFREALEVGGRVRGPGASGRARRAVQGRLGVDYFRKPYGLGWALIGDAKYNKDPITAQGISDAFRDAEACATALDDAFTGRVLARGGDG
jgi:2-polyprenyl-6-methoxyphenol hydroxylase-like FAD-dependent oxidoreductase